MRLSLRNSKSSSLVLAPSSFAFDQVVASGIGAGMQNVECGWLIRFALGILLSVIQLCLIHSLPESPRVMILRGREDIARQTYQRICSKASEEIIDLKSKITVNQVKATTQMQRSISSWKRTKKVWTHGPYRRAYRVTIPPHFLISLDSPVTRLRVLFLLVSMPFSSYVSCSALILK